MRVIDAVLDHSEARPGPRWHAHGSTRKDLWVVDDGRLRRVRLRKQRWRNADTGATCHDRPAWDVPGSPFGLDVVFVLIGVWLLATVGLQRVDWPWTTERPCRRTVQRWAARLAPQAARWLAAIRLACIELAAPRPLEETLPTGGIPPPTGRVRHYQNTATARQLKSSAWLITSMAHPLYMPIRTLLTEARRRWTTANPSTA